MVETGYFHSGDNELFYSCTVPPGKAADAGVMFVHAGSGNRLGPHRMFVEMAEGLNILGYPTFRFDLSGCGDSTGAISRNGIRAQVTDVVEATRFFVALTNLKSVVLLGISRGAHICFTVMAEYHLPLGGMILLSMPVSSTGSALKSFGSRLAEYTCKLKDPKYLRKLLSGQADITQIRKTLMTALRLGHRYRQAERKTFKSKCQILFIYGQRDPISAKSRRHYTSKCHQNNLVYDLYIVAGANHSFFHYKWKEEICNVSERWLEKILN